MQRIKFFSALGDDCFKAALDFLYRLRRRFVFAQLQLTDPDLKSRDRVVKKTEKDSLYTAMDVATVWLDRALSTK